MRQIFIKRGVSGFMRSSRGLENKVLSIMNEVAEEVNPLGGVIDRYEILNSERWGKDISVIFLVNYKD